VSFFQFLFSVVQSSSCWVVVYNLTFPYLKPSFILKQRTSIIYVSMPTYLLTRPILRHNRHFRHRVRSFKTFRTKDMINLPTPGIRKTQNVLYHRRTNLNAQKPTWNRINIRYPRIRLFPSLEAGLLTSNPSYFALMKSISESIQSTPFISNGTRKLSVYIPRRTLPP